MTVTIDDASLPALVAVLEHVVLYARRDDEYFSPVVIPAFIISEDEFSAIAVILSFLPSEVA